MHSPGDASEKVLGPSSENDLLKDLEAHAEDFWSTWNNLDSMLEEDIDMPLACLETLEWTPAMDSWTDEDPGSEFTHLSTRTRGLDSLNLEEIASLDDAAASQACSRPCTVTRSFTVDSRARQPQAEQATAQVQTCATEDAALYQQSAAAVSARDQAEQTACVSASGMAPQEDTIAAPVNGFRPPPWVEPGFMGGAQRAAAAWVAAAAVTDAKNSPLLRYRAAAAQVASPDQAPPALLPEVGIDLVRREPAQRMPRLPAERATNRQARCSSQRKRAKLAVRNTSADVLLEEKEALEGQVVNLLNRHEQLSLDLPVRMQQEEASFTASIVSCLAAAGPAMPPTPSTVMAPTENLHRAPMLEAVAEHWGDRGILWSTIVTFLKLSKPQKDNLAAAYIAHMQWVDALRSKCSSDTAPSQTSGQLTGIAMQEQDILQSLTNTCCQVLDTVQLDNLHALAPSGTSAVLALCRELAAPSRAPSVGTTAGATAAVGTPPVQRRQAVRSRSTAHGTQAGTDACAANPNASSDTKAQAAPLPAKFSKRRKRQTPNLP